MFGENHLSKIAKENISASYPALDEILKVTANPYDEVKNKDGILNLGMAVNKLNDEEILETLNKLVKIEKHDLDYGVAHGSVPLREAVSGLFNKYFAPRHDIVPDDIVVTNGCTAALDLLAATICDPGDAVLIPAPYYSQFETDLYLKPRAQAHSVHVPVDELESEDQVKYFEAKVAELKGNDGIAPKMMIVCNPHNPLGRCYPAKVIEALLRFANRHNIYVIMDEIYALSVYRTPEDVAESESASADVVHPFKSVLSFENLNEIIDPSLVVVLHGLSKDFCMNGLRMGWIVSPFNKNLVSAAKALSETYYMSSIADSLVTSFLSDTDSIDKFISTNKLRLKENYNKITGYLKQHEIPYVPAYAGVFVWVDLRKYLMEWRNKNLLPGQAQITSTDQLTFDDEFRMWADTIDKGKIYITSGQSFKSDEPGWFRLIFAIPWDTLKTGLDRLLEFISK
ncbi:1-aminocyclopropane-1-carboxylate synthase-like protein 1 [Zancudomyces culisetae]|uniref:1-aminocyclopropane-1-carboxylate synthase-like protein 1 n=1 Tax=Zancudomyces culisetae TaxID=1213189 RepID=A0A1R1PGT9_ZANCU|nr:1-aminocyclopropane-1-carboxylate synthase-like protein 1 [Zancudomyces culisetae]OMH85310.1 1-aminocyclopropane-1-carboxylate synthase-like protein 1 [Zancudomyces culisetae]|eukprot:OMH80190.1 1-aminocyclopropane-1-carboxylate synthase-like protein 1 [Zancudomyces culisetae]